MRSSYGADPWRNIAISLKFPPDRGHERYYRPLVASTVPQKIGTCVTFDDSDIPASMVVMVENIRSGVVEHPIGALAPLNRITIVILSIFLLVSAHPGHSQTERCTTAQVNRALNECDTLRSWDALYRSYKKFLYCDDGAIAEGYSESVARILVDHWNTLPRFAQLARHDAGFRPFVIGHVNETLNLHDVEKIKENSLKHCPTGLRTTCADLVKQALK